MSLALQPDSGGAAVIGMNVNQLLPLSCFEHQGSDSGLVSPQSPGGSPVEKPSATTTTRGDYSYGVETASDRFHTTRSPVEDDPFGPLLSSHGHMLAFGGPGFSVGLINPSTGETVRLPIPATDKYSCDDPFKFTESCIQCVYPVGEYQVWLGTDQGTVHIFDFCPITKRLGNHCFLDIKESVTCICSRVLVEKTANRRDSTGEVVEVVVGTPKGYLVTFRGPANATGGLDRPLQANRQVIRLLPPNSHQATSVSPVSSVLYVNSHRTTSLWCVCGEEIVILDAGTWRHLKQMEVPRNKAGKMGLPPKGGPFTSVLLDTEVGVWCAASFTAIVTLWNKEDFSFETQIATCSMSHEFSNGNVSALDFAHPFLFLGTTGGHVLVFKVQSRFSSEKGARVLELVFSAGEGLPFDTVVALHTKPTKAHRFLRAAMPASPSEEGTEILILGKSHQPGDVSETLVRRLTFSHYGKSASVSPNSSSCSTPPFSRQKKTVSSQQQQHMSLNLSLPLKLTLAQVSPHSSNFLPLKH